MAVFDYYVPIYEIKRLINAADIYAVGNSGDSVRVVFPNVDIKEGVRPRVEAKLIDQSATSGSLKITDRLQVDLFYCFTVVVDYNRGEKQGYHIAQQVADVYSVGRYSLTNCVLELLDAPNITNFVPVDSTDYRGMVTMRFRATST